MHVLKSEFDNQQYLSLVEMSAQRYRRFGRFIHGFVRGKLLHDPVYRAIVQLNSLPAQGNIVDLGCGRGILLALLTTMRHLNKPVINHLHFKGIELRAKDARVAHETLGTDADIVHADIRNQRLESCQSFILLDVLLYMQAHEQESLLFQIAQALSPDGVLMMREADAGAGLRYIITWLGERCCALARGHWRQHYHYRSQKEWLRILESLGFSIEIYPMSEGTPFANVLFIARKSSE